MSFPISTSLHFTFLATEQSSRVLTERQRTPYWTASKVSMKTKAVPGPSDGSGTNTTMVFVANFITALYTVNKQKKKNVRWHQHVNKLRCDYPGAKLPEQYPLNIRVPQKCVFYLSKIYCVQFLHRL